MEPKRFYRSNKNKVIAGICGGIAEYFNIDSVIVRLLFMCFLFASMGSAFLIYIVAVVIVPKMPDTLIDVNR